MGITKIIKKKKKNGAESLSFQLIHDSFKLTRLLSLYIPERFKFRTDRCS